MFNHSESDFSIKVGDRIAQLVCEKISYPDIQVLPTLEKDTKISLSALLKDRTAEFGIL